MACYFRSAPMRPAMAGLWPDWDEACFGGASEMLTAKPQRATWGGGLVVDGFWLLVAGWGSAAS